MKRRVRLFEGRSKIVYEGPKPQTNILFFKDDVSNLSAANREVLDGRGVLSNRISEHIFTSLKYIGIPTHFIKRLNMREQLVRAADIIPLKVAVRNAAVGSLAHRFNLTPGTQLSQPIIEFFYKNQKQNYPLVNEDHIAAFNIATAQEIDDIIQYAMRINDFLVGFFASVNLQLLDFKLEFGRLYYGNIMQIMVVDDLSPENIRLFDTKNDQLLTSNLANETTPNMFYYTTIANRLGLLHESERPKTFTPYLVP